MSRILRERANRPFLPCIVLLTACSLADAGGGAAFLKLPVHARTLGLGYGTSAVADDTGSMVCNPAGLARVQSKELGLLYAPHLQGMALGWIAYAQPTPLGSLGIGYLSLRSGSLDGRDDWGNPTGSLSAEDRALILSFATALGRGAGPSPRRPRAGASLKLIQSRVASYAAATYAADLGIQAPIRAMSRSLSVGAAVRNLGPGLKLVENREPLPLEATLAMTTQVSDSFLLGAGVRHLVHEGLNEFNIGTEVSPFATLALRASYGVSREAGPAARVRNLLALGMGIHRGHWRVDYAILPSGDVGSTQRLSLALRFDGLPERRAWAPASAWQTAAGVGDEP